MLSYIHTLGCKEAVSDIVMLFPAQVRGSDASVMLDSGVSCNAISAAAAKRLALDIQSPTRDPVVVQLADGHTVSHVGSTMLDCNILVKGCVSTDESASMTRAAILYSRSKPTRLQLEPCIARHLQGDPCASAGRRATFSPS
jgi:Aspartyl protease